MPRCCVIRKQEQQWADPLDVVRTGLLPRWRVSQNSIAEMGSLLSTDPAITEQHRSVADGYGKMMHFWANAGQNSVVLVASSASLKRA
ncbi:MAG: hypothetical protein U0175_35010 [Caldilineaceae bacterium]